ncbi:MAG: methylated-DNA--[protein]-cysteine S-methyltransferase [Dehalococcoidia bacterium]|nr:methylated-DNA--[protein]-cysteine S-methyltransferase [Dehalococcoidia bacterium]
MITETPMGYAGVALTDAGICRATLFHETRAAAERELAAYGAVEDEHPLAEQASRQLQAYAAGTVDALARFPVDLERHSEAQRTVWLALREVPAGETRSYGWLAEHAGLGRGGARAAGTMNGENPVPLWLPCHRIIASDGGLGGFAGGLAMKTRLLEHEGALPKRMI